MTWIGQLARRLSAKRRTLVTTHALMSLTICLPALTGAAEAERSTPAAARIEVTHTDEGLRVHAMQARPEDVVRRIAEIAGFEVHVARELGRTVTLTASDPTLEGALRRVLGTASVVMLYGPRRASLPPRIEAVWIYGPGGQPDGGAGHAVRAPSAFTTRRAQILHRHPTATARGRAVAALTSDLRSVDQHVRAEAVEALTSLGGPTATLRLGEAVLGDAVPQVRLLAVHALEVLGTEQARVFLERAVDDPDPHVSTAAADVLTRLP